MIAKELGKNNLTQSVNSTQFSNLQRSPGVLIIGLGC